MKKFSKPFISIFLTIVIVISMLPMAAFAASYNTDYWNHSEPSRTLSNGSRGDDVKWLQCSINNLIVNGDRNGSRLSTSKLDVDGAFGNATKTAVLAFQRKYNLDVDALFGPASRSKMKSVLRSAPIVKPTKRQFSWPVPGVAAISSAFVDGRNHGAIDIAAPTGTSVRAAAAGTVQTYPGGWNGGAGNYVVITHKIEGKTYLTVYMHLSQITIANGATVSAGTEIGKVGSTGNSSGPHLDFSIREGSYSGTRLDPGYYTTIPSGLYNCTNCANYVNEINTYKNNVYALSAHKHSNY
ncbi:MAG: hypothetical protein E7494_00820 [Ruminococcus albus]|jgi:murein DD-endopeptidase MepM/ murein hydrolase activator NlpD|nr:hypothetical protein [Ruminococcus albus]